MAATCHFYIGWDPCESHVATTFWDLHRPLSHFELELAIFGSSILGLGKISSKAKTTESLTNPQTLDNFSNWKVVMLKKQDIKKEMIQNKGVFMTSHGKLIQSPSAWGSQKEISNSRLLLIDLHWNSSGIWLRVWLWSVHMESIKAPSKRCKLKCKVVSRRTDLDETM